MGEYPLSLSISPFTLFFLVLAIFLILSKYVSAHSDPRDLQEQLFVPLFPVSKGRYTTPLVPPLLLPLSLSLYSTYPSLVSLLCILLLTRCCRNYLHLLCFLLTLFNALAKQGQLGCNGVTASKYVQESHKDISDARLPPSSFGSVIDIDCLHCIYF